MKRIVCYTIFMLKNLSPTTKQRLKRLYAIVFSIPPLPWLFTGANKVRYANRLNRKLEIGPGHRRIPGFETLSVVPERNVDYITNAIGRLPFSDDTFTVVYASHVLEHIPWPVAVNVVKEWIRILKPGGVLEIWVPDGVKICDAWLDFELRGNERWKDDGWPVFNPDMDACRWANARLLRFGDGPGGDRETNWHHGFYSPRYLCKILEQSGLQEVRLMDRSEVRGYDHGWINLGARGIKK